MLSIAEIEQLVTSRLADAEALFAASRYDGAIYLCGYAVELKLKSKICRTLGWVGFPSSSSEFKELSSFKTHNLEILIRLSGVEHQIKTALLAEWSIVSRWNPESRYNPTSSANQANAQAMIDATKALLAAL